MALPRSHRRARWRTVAFGACVLAIALLHALLLAPFAPSAPVRPLPALHVSMRTPLAPVVPPAALPKERGSPAAASDAVEAPRPVFWAAEALDRPPVPVSAPDTARLDGLVWSGLPLRLRLFVDAAGRVVDVQPLVVAPGDEAALPRLREMFVATAFIPGRRAGHDVPSRLDLELTTETVVPGA